MSETTLYRAECPWDATHEAWGVPRHPGGDGSYLSSFCPTCRKGWFGAPDEPSRLRELGATNPAEHLYAVFSYGPREGEP